MRLKNKPHLKEQFDFSLIHWAGLVMLVGFLFIFPFKAGLFMGDVVSFEAPLLEGIIYILVMTLFTTAQLIRKWELRGWKALLTLGIWLLPIVYYIATFNAATYNMSIQGFIVAYCFAALFVSGVYLTETERSRQFLEFGLMASGYMIVLYGYMNVFGQTYYANAVWVQAYGNRLTAVFQYPNAYAAYLTALLVSALYCIVRARFMWLRYIHAMLLVPMLLALLLTLSRGALVLIPIIILLTMLFLRISQQITMLFMLLIGSAATIVILPRITHIMNEVVGLTHPTAAHGAQPISAFSDPALGGWLWLIAASLVCMLAFILYERYINPWISRRLHNFEGKNFHALLLPAAAVIVGAFAGGMLLASPMVQSLLPENIASRIVSINFNQHSVLERMTFYRDALKLSQDYPLFGAGGGAWGAIYETYQNNPYISRQTHSYIFQLLVEIGWVGLAVVLLFMAIVFWLYIRNYFSARDKQETHFVFFLFAVSILIHSLIDFDMSYFYLASIVFVCLGAMLSPFELKILRLRPELGKTLRRIAYPAVIGVSTLVMLFFVFRLYGANMNFHKAVALANEGGRSLQQIMEPVDAAIQANPANSAYTLFKVDLLTQVLQQTRDLSYLEPREQLLKQLKQYEPYNRQLILAEYRHAKDSGRNDEAIAYLEEGIAKFGWDIKFYEAAIMEYSVRGTQLRSEHPDDAERAWTRAMEIYDEVLSRQARLKDLPADQLQGRDFSLRPLIRSGIGQIYFYQGRYSEAADILKTSQNLDLKSLDNREIVRYYLAALHALGEKDGNLMQRLIQSDEHERIALDQVIASIPQ